MEWISRAGRSSIRNRVRAYIFIEEWSGLGEGYSRHGVFSGKLGAQLVDTASTTPSQPPDLPFVVAAPNFQSYVKITADVLRSLPRQPVAADEGLW